MIYLLTLGLISILAILENLNRLPNIIKNKYFYVFLTIIFVFFVGLRYEVGCDWESYNWHFNNVSSKQFINLLINEDNYYDLGYSIITKIISLKFNFYAHNLIYAILFVVPLFIFSSQIKRTYLSLVIAYPYYIVVIGMGPIRQSICISFLFLSLLFINKGKYWIFYYLTIISALIHQSSILINGIIFLNIIPSIKRENNIYKYLFISIVCIVLIYNYEFITNKIYSYTFYYLKIIKPANSALIIWLINFSTSIIYLKYKNKFKNSESIKKIISSICISEIFLLPLLFYNSVIGYRLLLYYFPKSIYISTLIPDLKILNLNKNFLFYSIILISNGSLFFWLNFASHSYCWLPYRNIIFN